MFCPRCGVPNDDGAPRCTACGAVLPSAVAPRVAAVPRADIPNYLVHAIIVTMFCCLPFGIVSIVYAAQVNAKLDSGDIDGALRSSAEAKRWVTYGVIAWAIQVVVVAVFLGITTFATIVSHPDFK